MSKFIDVGAPQGEVTINPGEIVFGKNALPQMLSGLGYVALGKNSSGMQGVTQFNLDSSKGKRGAAPWSTKGSFFSGPSDRKLAEWVYRFQHSYQKCPGSANHLTIRSQQHAESMDPYKVISYCKNRDGMIGQATACQIVRAITTGVPFWGQFWNDNLDMGANLAHFTTGAGKDQGCSFHCRDVGCNKRAVTNCPPCGDSRENTTSTGAHNEKNDGQISTVVLPPGAFSNLIQQRIFPTPAPTPQPAPRPQPAKCPAGTVKNSAGKCVPTGRFAPPQQVTDEGDNFMVYAIAGLAIVGAAYYYVTKKK